MFDFSSTMLSSTLFSLPEPALTCNVSCANSVFVYHADMSTRTDSTNYTRMLSIDSTNCIFFCVKLQHASSQLHIMKSWTQDKQRALWSCTFDHEKESGLSATAIFKPTTTINTKTASSLALPQLKHQLQALLPEQIPIALEQTSLEEASQLYQLQELSARRQGDRTRCSRQLQRESWKIWPRLPQALVSKPCQRSAPATASHHASSIHASSIHVSGKRRTSPSSSSCALQSKSISI